jgi:hypothetical protein
MGAEPVTNRSRVDPPSIRGPAALAFTQPIPDTDGISIGRGRE